MKSTNLMPLTAMTTAALFNAETGETTAKYFEGYPRQYRFDASRGIFNLNGEVPLTTAKQAFSFVPLAYRVFEATLFGYNRMKWTEFFFLNAENQVCATLFHQFSTESFLGYVFNHLLYEGLNPCQVKWTVTANPKQNALTGSTYYIAQFAAEEIDRETLETADAVRATLPPLYRGDTVADDTDVQFSLYYGNDTPLSINTPVDVAALLDAKNDKASRNFAKGVVPTGVTA